MANKLAHKADPFQQQAIDSMARGIRIVAPAGSGKSETLARRVAKRIDDGVDPQRILVLTFDNAAKKSLTHFFGTLLDRRSMPQIRSLNGHGKKILQRFAPSEDKSPGGKEYTALERRWNAETDDYPILGWDGVDRKLTDVFYALKEQGFFPNTPGMRQKATEWLTEDYLRLPRQGESATLASGGGVVSNEQSHTAQLSAILDAFDKFEDEMRSLDAMNWIDQKSRAARVAFRSKRVMQDLHDEFDEIVVDECQDISRLDAMLVYYTAGPNTAVVLAGDDDQTLYEWRNAHSLYLRKPDLVFRDIQFETIHLDLNYRSPQEILGPAVKLISHNVERIEKSPTSGVLNPGALQVYASPTESAELAELVRLVKAEVDARESADEIAVLVPSKGHIRHIQSHLRNSGIPLIETDRAGNVITAGVDVTHFLGSKGRQWPVVFIPHLNDRDIPDSASVRKGEVESIRRRLYVAMTRASEKLVLSYVRGGEADRVDATPDGEIISTNGASRFLFEAGVVTASEPEVERATEATDAAEVAKSGDTVAPPKTTKKTEADVPSPAGAPAPAPTKKAKRQPWEPRDLDTRRMEKARREWDAGDYDDAIRNAFKPVESLLHRTVRLPRGERDVPVHIVIRLAIEQRLMDMAWHDRVQNWRQARNHAEHDLFARGTASISPEQYRDWGFELVNGVSDLFAHIAERNAPQQMALETHDDILKRQQRLVTLIQQGKPIIDGKRPIRAIWFDAETEQFDVLTLQLMMVLRDVRFYVPDEYRWDSSPLVSKFAVDAIGYLPERLRSRPGNRLRMSPGDPLNQLLSRWEKMVEMECEETNAGRYLHDRISDAIGLENGNFHAGIKLNPRVKA